MTFTDVLRIAVSLAVVFGLLLFARRLASKRFVPQDAPVKVVARQGVGAKSSIIAVDAGGKRHILAMTEGAVTVVDSFEAPPEPVIEAAPVPDFKSLLAPLLQRGAQK